MAKDESSSDVSSASSNLSMLPQYHDETAAERAKRKYRDSPFMVYGLAGCMAVCGLGAYMYKRRGTVSTSLFLMQLRVAAQGTVVGMLTIGVGYNLYERFIHRNDPNYHPADRSGR